MAIGLKEEGVVGVRVLNEVQEFCEEREGIAAALVVAEAIVVGDKVVDKAEDKKFVVLVRGTGSL